MTTKFAQQTSYTRLPNGTDVYALKVKGSGVVVANVALPGGDVMMREVVGLKAMFADVFPSATKTKSKAKVKERFDALGAQVGVSVGKEHVVFSLTVLPANFDEALELLFEVLTQMKISPAEWEASRVRIGAAVLESAEDTSRQANIALLRALYDKKHPHYASTTADLYTKLQAVHKESLLSAIEKMNTGIGALVTVVGDMVPSKAVSIVSSVAKSLEEEAQKGVSVEVSALTNTDTVHHIVSIQDKENVNTLTGIPCMVTVSSDAYVPLSLAVRALGGSSTGRLFNELRTKQSLTYGAYASLDAYSKTYPGHLRTSAIFPNNLFAKGRAAMCTLVGEFCDGGITARELSEQKEQIRYAHVLGLSTVRGLSMALTGVLLSGNGVEYLDNYVERVQNLTLREVNSVVKEHIDFSRIKTAAAGSVADEGKII